MKPIVNCLVLGALCAALSLTASAQTSRDQSAVRAEQSLHRVRLAASATDGHFQAGLHAAPGLDATPRGVAGPVANPYRAYPPSCIADPLPDEATGPDYSRVVDLAAYDLASDSYQREPVTVTVWRVPCSSSNGPARSVTLLRLERSGGSEGNADTFPVFPGVRIAQGGIGFDDSQAFIRIAPEPNTVVTDVSAESPVIYSTTYVLENYAESAQARFDFNQAFSLRFDNFFTQGTRQYVLDVPAYVASQSSYPTAFEPLPINGYLSSNYYDPAHSGEGMVVQVFELDDGRYSLSFTWFTFGPQGQPYWLFGNASFEPGTREIDVPTGYRDNGGFAGDFGDQADIHRWGTVGFSFDDCNHVQFTYEAQSGLPQDVPQGSGSRTWQRLANVNGLTCE